MDFRAVRNEFLNRYDVKNMQRIDTNNGEVEVGQLIHATDHHASIRFCTPGVNDKISSLLIEPGTLDLNTHQLANDLVFERLKNYGLLGNISFFVLQLM